MAVKRAQGLSAYTARRKDSPNRLWIGDAAPSSTTLEAGNYILGDVFNDVTGNVLYVCTTAGTASTSAWTAFASGSPAAALMFWGVDDVAITNTTSYAGAGWSAATEIDVQMVMPRAGTIKNLTVLAETDPAGADTYTVTLRKNGVDTTLVAVVNHADYAAVVQDTTHTVAVVAGDLISLKIVGTATAAGDTLQVSALLA